MLVILKALLSGVIIALASETAKRVPIWGAILVSVPLTSLLTVIWLYLDTRKPAQAASFLEGVFWAHLPTMLFFVLCPALLRHGMGFWLAILLSLGVTAVVFVVYAWSLRRLFGIEIL